MKGIEAILPPTLWEEKRAEVRASGKMAGPKLAIPFNLASVGDSLLPLQFFSLK
jgi:hypothetical protein